VRHSGALAAWDDEAGHSRQLLLGADLDSSDALDFREQRHVLAEAALQREHADCDARRCGGRAGHSVAALLDRHASDWR
jgi:hypothetical protein